MVTKKRRRYDDKKETVLDGSEMCFFASKIKQ